MKLLFDENLAGRLARDLSTSIPAPHTSATSVYPVVRTEPSGTQPRPTASLW